MLYMRRNVPPVDRLHCLNVQGVNGLWQGFIESDQPVSQELAQLGVLS